MTDISKPLPGFTDPAPRVWLNSAHQAILTDAGRAAAHEAVRWKAEPWELTQERFDGVPKRLRAAIGNLVNVPADDIILANSASYGLNVVASGFPWQQGDEVLVMAGDFPSDILPWLRIEQQQDIKVKRIRPNNVVVEPDELEASITSNTRLFCITLVHSLSGHAIDLDAIGAVCRAHGVTLMLNISQALGARPLDLSTAPVDAVTSVGFKWLCGPYGTGFCWIRPELRTQMKTTKAYWLAMQTAAELGAPMADIQLPDRIDARAYDVFGTANFFNFVPFTASLEHLASIGLEKIRDHDQALVQRFIDGLDQTKFQITSRTDATARRSTLIFFTHRDENKNKAIHEALKQADIYTSLRAGRLRAAPHLYNTAAHIDAALEALHRAA